MLKLKYILYIFIIIWKMNMYNYFMENKQKQNDLTTFNKSFEQPIDVQGIQMKKTAPILIVKSFTIIQQPNNE